MKREDNTTVRFHKFNVGDMYSDKRIDWNCTKNRPHIVLCVKPNGDMVVVSTSTSRQTTLNNCRMNEGILDNDTALRTFMELNSFDSNLSADTHIDCNEAYITNAKIVVSSSNTRLFNARIESLSLIKSIVRRVLVSKCSFRIKECLVKQYPDCI